MNNREDSNNIEPQEPPVFTGVIKAVRASEQNFVEDIEVVLNDTLKRKGKVKFSCIKTQEAVENSLESIHNELNSLKENILAIQKDEAEKDEIMKKQEQEKESLHDLEEGIKALYRSTRHSPDAELSSEVVDEIFSKVRQEIDVLMMSARNKLAREHHDQIEAFKSKKKRSLVTVEAETLLPGVETTTVNEEEPESNQGNVPAPETLEEENPTEEIPIVTPDTATGTPQED